MKCFPPWSRIDHFGKYHNILMQDLGGQTKSIMVFSEVAYQTYRCLFIFTNRPEKERMKEREREKGRKGVRKKERKKTLLENPYHKSWL